MFAAYPIAAGIGMAVAFMPSQELSPRNVAASIATGWFFALPIFPLSIPAIVGCLAVGAGAGRLSLRFGFLQFAFAGAVLAAMSSLVAAGFGVSEMFAPAAAGGIAAALFLRCVGIIVRGQPQSPPA